MYSAQINQEQVPNYFISLYNNVNHLLGKTSSEDENHATHIKLFVSETKYLINDYITVTRMQKETFLLFVNDSLNGTHVAPFEIRWLPASGKQ